FILGGKYYCCGIGDLQVVFDNPTRRKVVEVFRQFVPELVFGAPLSDYMLDHEMAGQLIRDAAFTASLPNYSTGQENPAPHLPKVPHLYYMQPLGNSNVLGEPVLPEFCIDITTVMETKKEMLAQHASQREWLRVQHKMDQYIINMQQESEAIGKLIGVPYAEGFRLHKASGHPRSNVLQELLPEYIHPLSKNLLNKMSV
ncbi:MAG TPA: PIG-L family deacetylase, partial [bacterium]|nr:PIG-L family deacetylase [bacterium]